MLSFPEINSQAQSNEVNDELTSPQKAGAIQLVGLPTAEQAATTSTSLPRPPSSIRKNSKQLQVTETNKVGQSVFYDCVDLTPSPGDKQDAMRPDRSDTDEESNGHFLIRRQSYFSILFIIMFRGIFAVSDIDQDCTSFSGVTYLASATINAPKSETEIQRKISELNTIYDDDAMGLKVSISIPFCADGLIV